MKWGSSLGRKGKMCLEECEEIWKMEDLRWRKEWMREKECCFVMEEERDGSKVGGIKYVLLNISGKEEDEDGI